jgi:tetracycline repressor-like protein
LNWSVRWFNPDGALTASEIAEGFADYLIRGLLAEPEGARRLHGVMSAARAQGRVPPETKRHRSLS